MERGGTKLEPQLAVRVHRQLPPAAYILLIVSVLCASMYDMSLQLLVCTAPRLGVCHLDSLDGRTFVGKYDCCYSLKDYLGFFAQMSGRFPPSVTEVVQSLQAFDMQKPAPTGLALVWSATSALVCCLPWVVVSMQRRHADCLEALRDPTHTKIAIVCGTLLTIFTMTLHRCYRHCS